MFKTALSRLAFACLAASTLGATACSPAGDVDVDSNRFLIYDLDQETGEYKLRRVQIKTIQDVSKASGEVVYLRGGGNLLAGTTQPQTREEWERVLLIEETEDPHVEYTIDDDGTVIPWDFDSAMMLTVYHHIERAHEYFDSIPIEAETRASLGIQGGGGVGDLVGRIPLYYYPSISILGIPIPVFVDNAAYAFTLDAFIVPPRRQLVDAVPIYANRGVMTHEYTHAVFNRIVYKNERVPDPTFEGWSDQDGIGLPLDPQAFIAYNELGGLDEGIADIFGALDTDDPNYIAASISEELIDRDLAKPRFYEECLAIAVETGAYPAPSVCGGNYPSLSCTNTDGSCVTSNPVDSQGVRFDYAEGDGYDSHHLGAVIASILWELKERHPQELDEGVIDRIVIQSMHDIAGPTTSFRVSDFFNAVHRHLPSQIQESACSLFEDRLLEQADLECTPSSTP